MSDAPSSEMGGPTLCPDITPSGGVMYYLGSLPLGSRVKSYNPWTGEHVVSGYLMMVNVSRTRVMVTEEGDGNFLGSVEDRTLRRIYDLDEQTFQLWTPVEWQGVDQDVRKAILEAEGRDEGKAQIEAEGNRLLEYYLKEPKEAV